MYNYNPIINKYFRKIDDKKADEIFRNAGYENGIEDATSVPVKERDYWLWAKPQYLFLFEKYSLEIVLVKKDGHIVQEMGSLGSIDVEEDIIDLINDVEKHEAEADEIEADETIEEDINDEKHIYDSIIDEYYDKVSNEEADKILREAGWENGVEDFTSVPEDERECWLYAKSEYLDDLADESLDLILLKTNGHLVQELGAEGPIDVEEEIVNAINEIKKVNVTSEPLNKDVEEDNNEDFEVDDFLNSYLDK